MPRDAAGRHDALGLACSRRLMLQGDMIPWTIGQQYQDTEFPRLSGARVVRIAAHPDMTRAGYGTRALELLRRYYEGDLADLVLSPAAHADARARLCAWQKPQHRQ